MSFRAAVAAAVGALVSAGCGGGSAAEREVRILAPVWALADVAVFERQTGCRVELRVYDEREPLDEIARRRDSDVIARPARPGEAADRTEEFVRVMVAKDLEVTVPKRLAPAFAGARRPAGRRGIVWQVRDDGDNPRCARRWIAYATSQ